MSKNAGGARKNGRIGRLVAQPLVPGPKGLSYSASVAPNDELSNGNFLPLALQSRRVRPDIAGTAAVVAKSELYRASERNSDPASVLTPLA